MFLGSCVHLKRRPALWPFTASARQGVVFYGMYEYYPPRVYSRAKRLTVYGRYVHGEDGGIDRFCTL